MAFGNIISDEGTFVGFNRADFTDACLLSLIVEVERMALAEKETEWSHRQELEHVEADCKRTKQCVWHKLPFFFLVIWSRMSCLACFSFIVYSLCPLFERKYNFSHVTPVTATHHIVLSSV